jgi:hypothetical protein
VNPNDLVAILSQVYDLARQAGVAAGDVLHTVVTLRDTAKLIQQGYEIVPERLKIVLTTAEGQLLVINREVDITARKVGELDLRVEEKTGEIERAFPTITRAFEEKNLQLLADLVVGARGQAQNLWKIYSATIAEAEPLIERRLAQWGTFMEEKLGASVAQVRRAIESFRFEDAMGQAIEYTWGPHGPIAKKAEEAASGSPDFGPAMEVLFGARGTLASSARTAAAGTNLDPAFADLEEGIEQGVTTAMDKAGDAAAGRGAVALGTKLGEGARALGDIFTAVPQLYSSVSELGVAWNAPHKGAKEYMELFSKMGGALGQGVDTIQKLAGVTKIAAAAQAVFNAIMDANPIVLTVLAVLALIAVIVALIAYWDEVKAALRDNPWLAVVAALFGVIGVIVVVIAYWDEIKLAVLEAANFISIQAQRIGLFFMGVGNLIKQVWDWIVDSLYNAGIGILNTFSAFGAWIVNLFIGIANHVIDLYNDTVAYLPGVDEIERIGEVQATKLETRQVQQVSIEAAFAPAMGQVAGGLEQQIAAQRATIAAADEEDRARRARDAEAEERERRAREAERPALGAPAAPAGVLAGRPGLPEGAAAAAGEVDRSVRIEGGITVNINAERLEADAARLLSDEIVQRLKERLDALRNEQDFRAGVRSPAPV